MVNKLLIAPLLALSLVACQSTPSSSTAPTAKAQQPPAGCVAQTATHIPIPPDTCAGFGNQYTQPAIQNTGKTDAGSALKQLDPSITIGH
ncbi:MAG TPA: hypothetical protein VEH54_04770 [Steroidobacteraceae bacterium]|nr:hypothetical protein [Steroidobacteraceae bacterium]